MKAFAEAVKAKQKHPQKFALGIPPLETQHDCEVVCPYCAKPRRKAESTFPMQ